MTSSELLCKKIIELRDAQGTRSKCAVLSKYKNNGNFRTFLYYALSPYITYNLSEKALNSSDGIPNGMSTQFFDDIFSCCEYLSNLRGIDNATIRQVKSFIQVQSPVEQEIYTKLLAKTLRLGVTAKTVNKVIKDLIPEWEVQQAYPIDKYVVKQGTEFWLTQKLNGVRATYYKGRLISRSGVPYEGLGHILRCIDENIIEPLGLFDIVLDGELTLFNCGEMSDNEAFRTATGVINSDKANKREIGFTLFDALCDSVHFDGEISSYTYSKRRELLDSIAENLSRDMPVRVLPVLYHGKDQKMIESLLEKMVAEDKEGLMLNLDVPYRRARHSGILKVKRFYTMDLPIIRCEEGDGRLKGTLGSLVVSFKDNEVRVGSGFTDIQREMLWELRNNLEGVLCEVKYKEISNDKNTGLQSLQFPTFVRIRNDKSEPSYG